MRPSHPIAASAPAPRRRVRALVAASALLVGLAGLAGCKARLDRGAAVRDDAGAAASAAPGEQTFQAYDSVQTNARRKAEGTCLDGARPHRWVDGHDRPVLAAPNFPPGVTTLDTVMPAALDAPLWETSESGGVTIYSTTQTDAGPRALLDRFRPKDPHGADWTSNSPFERALAQAYQQAAALNLPRAALVVGRKLVSALKADPAETPPAAAAATVDGYKRCGDGVVEREYVTRDLVLALFARDDKFDAARKVLAKALTTRGADEADEKALKALMANDGVMLRVIWQEADKPLELIDGNEFITTIESYKTNSDLGLKSKFYLVKPYAAFRALDDQGDKPGAGGAADFNAAQRNASIGRLAAAAAGDADRDALAAPQRALEAALAKCGGARFNADCAALAAPAAALLAAVPAALRGDAAPDAARQGCRNLLRSGQTMRVGEALCSPNGKIQLVLQGDDNLVVYDAARTAKWASNTAVFGPLATGLALGADGNLRLLATNDGVLWESRTAGKGASTLTVSDDGFAQLKADGDRAETWNSKSWRAEALGPLDAEPMCGTYKGRIRRALEFIDKQATFDKIETAFSFGAVPPPVDGILGDLDLSAEINRLGARAQPETTPGSILVSEVLGEKDVFACIGGLAGNPNRSAIEFVDVQKALACARKPRAAALGDGCPDWGTESRVNFPDTGRWKQLGLIVPTDDAQKRWLTGSFADADAYCKARGRRVPSMDELTDLLKDYDVLGKDDKPLRNELFGMIFLFQAQNPPPAHMEGMMLMSSSLVPDGEQKGRRRYLFFSPDQKIAGRFVSDAEGTRDVSTWVCVSERTPPLP